MMKNRIPALLAALFLLLALPILPAWAVNTDTTLAANCTDQSLPSCLAAKTYADTANTVADTTDATSFCALYESATGVLLPKTDGGCTYAADTGTLNATKITTPSLNVNSGGAITSLLTGTYTPTRSAEANLDANVTPSQAQYMRLGDMVIVSGHVTGDPTTTLTLTSFELSLPIASNIGAIEDLAGSGTIGTIGSGPGVHVFGVVANDTLKMQWLPTNTSSQIITYIYMYQVI